MSGLIVADGLLTVSEFGKIRVTEEGWLSVFDLIQVCAEYKDRKSQYRAWEVIQEDGFEVSSKIRHFKFPGRGQKETPICDRQTALKILGLLPGKAGNLYRDVASKLVLDYLESPDKLAEAAIARVEDPKKLERISEVARQKYLAKGYKPAMNEIQERADGEPWAYIRVNSDTTKAILGDTPKNLLSKHEQETGKKLKSARQLPEAEPKLALFENCHSLQAATLKKEDVRGAKPVVNRCSEIADEFAVFLKKIGW